jgi:hypothetical protein
MLPAIFSSAWLFADDSSKTAPKAQNLVGSQVTIELRSGKILRRVTIEEAKPGKVPNTVTMLRVVDPTSGAKSTLGAAGVKRVSTADGECCLTFDAASKLLMPPGAEQPSASLEATVSKKSTDTASTDAALEKPAAARQPSRPAKRRSPKVKQEEAESPEAAEARREEFFKKTGVRLWPELTEEQQKAEVIKQKEYLEKVVRYFPSLNMQLQETRHFLFLSVLSPAQAAVYTPYLDSLHEQLCKAYGIKNPDKVWKGKVPVVVFGRSDQFAEFERVFFDGKTNPEHAQGFAHSDSSGTVVISCYCGDDPFYFGGLLVHETTHGFNYRYKSGQRLPSWLNEGIADWAAIAVVRGDRGARTRVRNAVVQAKKQGNLGGDFFTTRQIAPWQYGIAAGMVDFMLKSNPKAFRELIDAVKSGKKWEDALQAAYGVTPEELAAQFGMSMGIPRLMP